MLGIIVWTVFGMVCVLLAGQYGHSCGGCTGNTLHRCSGCTTGLTIYSPPVKDPAELSTAERTRQGKESARPRNTPDHEGLKTADYAGLAAGIAYIREHEDRVSLKEGRRLESMLTSAGGLDGVSKAGIAEQASLMELVLQLVMKIHK